MFWPDTVHRRPENRRTPLLTGRIRGKVGVQMESRIMTTAAAAAAAGNSVKRIDHDGGPSRLEDVMYPVSGGFHFRGRRGSHSPPNGRRNPSQSIATRSLCRPLRATGWSVVALFFLALLTCRPCFGHDPELLDMEDEDGKDHFYPIFRCCCCCGVYVCRSGEGNKCAGWGLGV